MSHIYTNENCIISLSSHSVCAVKEEASEAALFGCSLDCSKALETLAETGALHWCCIQIYRRSCRAFSISFYLPLSACPFPTTCTPGTTSLCISSSVSHVPDTWARIELRRFGEGCVWLESHVTALPPAHAWCEHRRHRGNCSAHQAQIHFVSGS